MAWKATGQPTVRKQRDKWVVRVDGIDTVTGKHRPRQLGTYPSQRSAKAAARSMQADDRSTERGTVSWLVRRYVAGRTDITEKAQQQYEWAIPHIENGLGAIPLATLDREDVARWIETLAAGGKLSKRSVQICRTVLRAALSEAVDEGLIPRSPGGSGRIAANGGEAGQGEGHGGVDRRAGRPLPRGDGRPSLGDRVPARRALRAASQRGARAAMGRPRHRRRRRCGSTRASWRPTRAPRGATPRTNAHDARSRSTTTRCACSPGVEPSKPPSGSPPARSGRTTT